MFFPSYRNFQALRRFGRWVPVARSLDLAVSPQMLTEALGFSPPYVLLESARFHLETGRFSLIVGEPEFVFWAKEGRVWIEPATPRVPASLEGIERSLTREGPLQTEGGPLQTEGGPLQTEGGPLPVLQRLLDSKSALRLKGLPPFVGGAVGFVSYDACPYLEEIRLWSYDDLGLPDLGFLFFSTSVVIDHAAEKLWVIALASPFGNPRHSYEEAVHRIDSWLERLGRIPSASFPRKWESDPDFREEDTLAPKSTHTRGEFEAMVRRAKEYIARGEIYQANLSQRFSFPLRQPPWQLYRRLMTINPSPFSAYADFGYFQITSSSPERFLRVKGDFVQTRPIAGTRPRGATAIERARLRQELILNEKERAEHLMLVDLERNDLGRIGRYGSVEVNELMVLEEYSHVIHIVSNVQGRLLSGVKPVDVISACFPGGTITGCPKIRSIEIIDTLEPVRRGLYTGSLGYVSATGDMDFNLLIRTALIAQGVVHVQAGAGIVADSDPSREYEETLHKAQALMEALHAEVPESEIAHVALSS